jgi:hypothetical protein
VAEREITDEDLDAMRARIAAATPGPWTSIVEGRDQTSGSSFIQTATQDLYVSGEDYVGGGGHATADLDFIANARQDMPRLIAEVERLRQELKGNQRR